MKGRRGLKLAGITLNRDSSWVQAIDALLTDVPEDDVSLIALALLSILGAFMLFQVGGELAAFIFVACFVGIVFVLSRKRAPEAQHRRQRPRA